MQSDNRIASLKVGLVTALMGLAGCFTSFPTAPADLQPGEGGPGPERPSPDVKLPDGAAPVDMTQVVLDANRTEGLAQPDLVIEMATLTDVNQSDLPNVSDSPPDSRAPDVFPPGTDVGADLATLDLAMPDVPVVIPDALADVCTGAACGGCSPISSLSCNGLQPRICDSTGVWKDNGTACKYICNNATGACAGGCAPSQKQCSGSQPQTCDSNGVWQDAGIACAACNPCSATTGACVAATGTPCDDGNACTTGETCQAGVCTGGTQVACSTPATCHGSGTCDPRTGKCTYPALSNTPCSDGNPCTTDTCQAGVCVSAQMVCNSPPPCMSAGTCSAGSCSYSQVVADGTTDLSCPSGKQTCYGGGCVQCVSDASCSGQTPSCDTSTHKCVCRLSSSGNVVQNGGFNTSVAGSTVGTQWDSEDSEGCSGSGSAYLADTGFDLQQCVPLTGGVLYHFGARIKDFGEGDSCTIAPYVGRSCDPGSDLLGGGYIPGVNAPGWSSQSTSFTAPDNAGSGLIWCNTVGGIRVDELYVNPSYNHF